MHLFELKTSNYFCELYLIFTGIKLTYKKELI